MHTRNELDHRPAIERCAVVKTRICTFLDVCYCERRGVRSEHQRDCPNGRGNSQLLHFVSGVPVSSNELQCGSTAWCSALHVVRVELVLKPKPKRPGYPAWSIPTHRQIERVQAVAHDLLRIVYSISQVINQLFVMITHHLTSETYVAARAKNSRTPSMCSFVTKRIVRESTKSTSSSLRVTSLGEMRVWPRFSPVSST